VFSQQLHLLEEEEVQVELLQRPLVVPEAAEVALLLEVPAPLTKDTQAAQEQAHPQAQSLVVVEVRVKQAILMVLVKVVTVLLLQLLDRQLHALAAVERVVT
jgi:hypothetical protein